MARKKKASVAALVSALCLLPQGCKKLPTAATIKPGEPTIIVILSVASANPDTVLTAAVAIAGNDEEIRVFGVDMTFDQDMFAFEQAGSGTLTSGWAGLDGNEIGPGAVRVGGFAGGASPIARGSQGTLAEIQFKVKGSGYGNGQQSQVCIGGYTDDIAPFRPETSCFTFTLKK